jgi:hypothetical protein
MIDKPLSIAELRKVAAKKAWEIYTGDTDPVDIPMSFYYAVDICIKESYDNVDKMITEGIRKRLDDLLGAK